MNFGIAISSGVAFLTTWLYAASVVFIGAASYFTSDAKRETRETAFKFFGACETVGGLLLLISNGLIFTDGLPDFGEDAWLRVTGRATVVLMFLSIFHLAEMRRLIALPALIILLGIINLKALHFLSIPFEATW